MILAIQSLLVKVHEHNFHVHVVLATGTHATCRCFGRRRYSRLVWIQRGDMWMSKVWNGQESAFRFAMTVLGVLIYVALPEAGDPDGIRGG